MSGEAKWTVKGQNNFWKTYSQSHRSVDRARKRHLCDWDQKGSQMWEYVICILKKKKKLHWVDIYGWVTARAWSLSQSKDGLALPSRAQGSAGLNTQYMTNSTLVSRVKMEYGCNFSISGLKMMMKSGLGKIFLKILHALTMLFLLLNLYFWSKFSNKNDMVSAWRNFKNILS